MSDAATASTPTRRVWHHVPRAGYRERDADELAPQLASALAGWVAAARSGQKLYPPFTYVDNLNRYYTPGVRREVQTRASTDAELQRNVRAALITAHEWDGYTIAHELQVLGWPADAELVQLCHRWSCDVVRARIAAWKARKAPQAA